MQYSVCSLLIDVELRSLRGLHFLISGTVTFRPRWHFALGDSAGVISQYEISTGSGFVQSAITGANKLSNASNVKQFIADSHDGWDNKRIRHYAQLSVFVTFGYRDISASDTIK